MTASGYTPSTRTPDHRRGDEREAEHHPEDPDRRPPPPHQRKVYGGEPQPGAHAGPGGQRPRPFHQGEQRHETGVDPPWMPLSEQSGAAAPGPSVHLPRRQPAGGAAAWRQDDRGGIAEQRGRRCRAAGPCRGRSPARRPATDSRPTMASTSSTRLAGMPWVCASASRWLRAARPLWTDFASSSAPTCRSGAAWSRYGRPLTVAVPAVGRSSPTIMRMVVDLPAPLGPRKPVTWPGRTVNDSSSTASVAPKRLVSVVASIMGSTLGTAGPLADGLGAGRGRARRTP